MKKKVDLIIGGNMIKEIDKSNISECVQLIRKSFGTVAKEFGITQENAPGFTAFSMSEEKLIHQMIEEKRPMYGFFDNDRVVG